MCAEVIAQGTNSSHQCCWELGRRVFFCGMLKKPRNFHRLDTDHYTPVNSHSNRNIHHFDGFTSVLPEKIEIFHGDLLVYWSVSSDKIGPFLLIGSSRWSLSASNSTYRG